MTVLLGREACTKDPTYCVTSESCRTLCDSCALSCVDYAASATTLRSSPKAGLDETSSSECMRFTSQGDEILVSGYVLEMQEGVDCTVTLVGRRLRS